MNPYNFLLFICVICISCENKNSAYSYEKSEKLVQLINNTSKSVSNYKKSDSYLVIPVENGCQSCISQANEYVRSGETKSSLHIILSAETAKGIRILFDESVLTRENVLLDQKGLARGAGVISFNPVLFILEGGEIIHEYELNVGNINEILEPFLQ